MNTNENFNWPQREQLCKDQLKLSEQRPTGTIVDGVPIIDYWKAQILIAHKHTATFDEMLDELAVYNDELGLHDAHEKLREFYGEIKYLAFTEWYDDGKKTL